MRASRIVSLLVTTLLLMNVLLPAAENPAVPGQVQFAGRIEGLNLTAEGAEATEVKAGLRGVTFSLFAEQSGGAALWVESQNVAVSGDGGYSTLLGAETAGGIPQGIFSDSGASGAARWLEVSYIGADGVQVTQPRVLLVSVPYAMKAGDAATLGGLPVSAFVLNTDAVASRVSDNGGLPGATVTDVLPSAAVTAGRIAKFNSALATDVVDSIITESSGKIGIGTTTPVGTIDVGGWASIPGDIQGVGSTISGDVFMGNTNGGIGRFRMASNALQGFFSWNQYYNGTNHKGMDATAPGWRVNIGGTGAEDAYYVERSPATAGGHVPARLFVVNGNGNVGINTGGIAPISTLDVGGWPDKPVDIVGVGSTISGDAFMGNVGGNAGRYRMASNGNQGFFSWNQYYNGTVHKGMDATAPGWRINVGGKGVEDAFYVERSPATAGTHVPARLFQVSGSGNVGIGTIAPTAPLHVVGNSLTTGTATVGGFTLTGNGAGAGKVLTSDANGTATWSAAGAGATLGANTFTATQTISSGNLALPTTAAGGTSGVITLNGVRFAHAFGSSNSFFGVDAGNYTMTGVNNVGIGTGVLYINGSGHSNTATGSTALSGNTTGSYNTATGAGALLVNDIGFYNSGHGAEALRSNSSGTNNTASGSLALFSNAGGSFNTASGVAALFSNDSGSYNTALGRSAGASTIGANANTSGSYNTFIGYSSGPGVPSASNLQNATAIGSNAVVSASNALVLGSIAGENGATNGVNVGIGTATPGARLDVVGAVRATGFTLTGNGASAGRVLTSDANGVASWQPGSTLGANTFTATQTISSGNLALPSTTSPTSGSITLGGLPFAHAYGSNNTFLGQQAGNYTMIGEFNTAIGKEAFLSNGNGVFNTATGFAALYRNEIGTDNTATGSQALVFNITGSGNTAHGSLSLLKNGDGSNNTASGGGALAENLDGDRNTATGTNALLSNTSGNENTAMGFLANVASGALSNATSLGARAMVSQSNSLVLGSIAGVNGATNSVNVGIGTAAPKQLLSLEGAGDFSMSLRNNGAPVDQRIWHMSNVSGSLLFRPLNDAENSIQATGIAFTRAGNLGIGTTSPPAPLSIAQSADFAVSLRNNGRAVDSKVWHMSHAGGDLMFHPVNDAENASLSLGVLYMTRAGNVAIGNTAPADKLQVSGEVRVLNCVRNAIATQIAGTCPSDARLKRNIRPLSAPGTLLGRVAALEPVRFNWRAEEFPEMQYGTEEVRGLIAQQVEQYLPELVKTAPNGFKAVNYSDLPLFLLQAIRELKAENDTLKADLAAQQAQYGDVVSKAESQDARISQLESLIEQRLGVQVSKAVSGQ